MGLIRQAGRKAVMLPGDIRDEALAERLVSTAVERFGGLDIALNNAGAIGANEPTPDIALERWRETLDVNLTAAFLGAKHQIPALLARGGGSLVFTGSFVGYSAGMPGMAAYAASKAALTNLTLSFARLLAPRVKVNAVAPSLIMFNQGDSQAYREKTLKKSLMGIEPGAEVAVATLQFLLDNPYITGRTLPLDGGRHLV